MKHNNLKKILITIIFISSALILSACSSTNNEVKVNPNLENYNLIKKELANLQSSEDNKNMINTNSFSDLVGIYKKAVIKTNMGDIEVEFYGEESPITVNNFLNLAQIGYYDGIKFHRVIKDFMIQAGDPLSKGDNEMEYGTGGPGYGFDDEINNYPLVKGSMAMANTGQPKSNGSQFFIVTAEATPWLDGRHTNFAKVISGMDVVEKIGNLETNLRDLPLEPVIIQSVELLKK